MAINLSAEHPGILLPEDVGRLVVQPVDRLSVAAQVSTVVDTASPNFRIPIVTDDVAAGWFAEGAEIAEQSPGTDELIVTPRKLAALTVISSELAMDSSPEAQAVVGMSIARDIARKLDAAYFGAASGEAPTGLEDLTGFTPIPSASYPDLDVFADAILSADAEGRTIGSFVTDYATALTLSVLKDDDTSNRPLLGSDPTESTRRQVLGVPLYVSPFVTAGTVWGLPADVCMVVRRTNVSLVVDRSRYFERDSIGVRATMRVAFGFPHPAAIAKIGPAAPA